MSWATPLNYAIGYGGIGQLRFVVTSIIKARKGHFLGVSDWINCLSALVALHILICSSFDDIYVYGRDEVHIGG